MTEREALRLALEALEMFCEHGAILRPIETRNAIKEALAQTEQNQFSPDWDAMAVMVEEQQRMAKRIAELEAAPPVLTSDTSQDRVAEMAKQRHEKEPVIDKSAAIRIATSLGWTPQRTWVGLTQEDIDIAFDDTQEGGGFWEFARAIEAKLKSKNT